MKAQQLSSIWYMVSPKFSQSILSPIVRRYVLYIALLVFAFAMCLLGIVVLRQAEMHTVSTQIVNLLHQLGLPFGTPFP